MNEISATLKRQLKAYSLANELSRVIASSTDIESVYRSLLLGLNETMTFHNIGIFGIDDKRFALKPLKVYGFEEVAVDDMELGLSFLAGEYTDSIFCNRHIIVDPVPEEDLFYKLGSSKYIAFPIVARVFSKDGDILKCGKNTCPCSKAISPYWWSEDTENEMRKSMSEDEFRQAAIKCSKFQCLGMLWLDLSERNMITSEEVSIINAILFQSAMVLETFHIQRQLEESHEKLTVANIALKNANKTIQTDLAKAQKIQKKLLPKSFPMKMLRSIGTYYASTSRVGGDYYDCYALDEHTLVFLVADVSGHGISAALVMSMFKVLLKAKSSSYRKPSELIEKVNELFLEEVQGAHFVTFFYGMINIKERTLEYASAGHNPVYLQQGQSLETLNSTGPVLGAFEGMTWKNKELKLEELSRLFLYTDGLIDARNSKGAMFGNEALEEILVTSLELNCEELVKSVLGSLNHFTEDLAFEDDVTILTLDA